MIFDYILNHTPWWVWLLIGVVVVGSLMPFIAPIWRVIPRPIKVLLGGIAGVFVAYIAGRNKGTQDAKQREKERDAEAVNRRIEINREVVNLDDASVDKRLDKWMRD